MLALLMSTLKAAAIQWDDGPNATVNSAGIIRQLEAASKQPGVVARNEGDAQKALAGAARRIDAIYQLLRFRTPRRARHRTDPTVWEYMATS